MPAPGFADRPPSGREEPMRPFLLPIVVSLLVLFVIVYPHKTPGPQARVVLIGDSFTAKWPGLEGTSLSGLQAANRGVPGDVTSLMLARFDRDVVAQNPRVVVILGGTNDLPLAQLDTIEGNLGSMVERAGRHGIAVVLGTVPPAGRYDSEHPVPEPPGHERIAALNERIRNLASRTHAGLADFHAALSDHRGYYLAPLTSDGVHPSAEGYARMEPLLRQAIAEAVSRKPRE